MINLIGVSLLVALAMPLAHGGPAQAGHGPEIVVGDDADSDRDVARMPTPRFHAPILEHYAKGGSTSRSRARGR